MKQKIHMDTATNITINVVEPGSNLPVPSTGLFTHGIGGPEVAIISTALIVLVLTTFALLRYKRKYNKTSIKSLGILAFIVSLATFASFIINTKAIDLGTNNDNSDSNLTVTTEDANLTIELADEPVFAVLPVDVTVAEATRAGYTLTAYTESTDLVSTTDSSNIIPMVATSEGELVALKDNTWGLALDNEPTAKDQTIYTSLSTDQDNPTILKTIDDYSETPANDTTTIYYAFYITPDTPYGIYTSSDINYKANKKQANVANVIYHGNGLYFNNNPAQTTNNVDYTVGITDKTAKYSHTPNINDEGEASGVVGYLGKEINEVISIPNASKLRIKLSYGGGYLSIYGGYPAGFLSFWQGTHPDYTTSNNADSTIKTCGSSDVTDGKFYGDRNNQDTIITTECEIEGNSTTFAYWITGGGPGSSGPIYGYYASVTGYDADGNIIYLPGNTQVDGEYQDPAQDLPYIFLGWNEDKDATAATYKSKNDIEQDLPLIPHQTTELYAIWQKATKITFDGNGSTSGEMQDKIVPAGTSTYVTSGNYSREGYSYTGWNTEPDGTGISYPPYQSFTVASDKSEVITLYAQWAPVTTIIYDGNGGTGSQRQQTIRAGETGSIYNGQSYFSRDGYIFSHWNTESDGTGTTYNQGDQFTASDQSTTITLYAQWISNVLDTGQTVNAKLKRLAGNSSASYSTQDTNVTTIARASTLPADFAPTNDNTISIDGSANPVYAWYDTDTTTIYYYTESDKIIMNPNSSYMFYNFSNLSDASSIADLDTTYVTNMSNMFRHAGYNATTFSLDLSSWDTSKVTNMYRMFLNAGYNATTWSIGDLSSWDTSKVTNMSYMFSMAGRNATTWSIGDLSSWDTSKVTNMGYMFYYAGSNATTFSLDLSSWDTSKVTNMSGMFNSAGYNATTWSVTIPPKTGDINNTTSAFYGQNSSVYATPASGKSFTLAAQANSNTTNTTESLNSVNNVEATIQGGSSGNRSVYATEDAEDTENDDDTSSNTTSTPSRQEPLGEHQSSTIASTEDTSIAIPMLIAISITLGASALALLAYKSRRREDE